MYSDAWYIHTYLQANNSNQLQSQFRSHWISSALASLIRKGTMEGHLLALKVMRISVRELGAIVGNDHLTMRDRDPH